MAHHDVDRFNRWAGSYDRHWLQRIVLEPLQRTVLELAQTETARPGTILDVGCGTGRLLRSAAQRFPDANLVGVDAASEMVKVAQTLTHDPKIAFRVATAEDLPFDDGAFDLVFSTLTFHHWGDQPKGIAEIARVLARPGYWLLADFMPTGLFKTVLRLFRLHQFPQPSTLDPVLTSSGLSVVGGRRVPGFGGQLRTLAIAARPGHPRGSALVSR